jgi:hypothetical protein
VIVGPRGHNRTDAPQNGIPFADIRRTNVAVAQARHRPERRIRWRDGRRRQSQTVNPVGKRYVSRRQVALLDRRILASANLSRSSIMLRMVLLGLLIPFGIAVVAAIELRTPPRSAVAVAQPLAETTVGISDSPAALAKADRLEIAAASSETPAQPAPVDERISPPEGIRIGPSEPPRVVNRHRHDPKPRKIATAALPKPKPKATDIKRTTISERSKTGDTEPCRLSAFGGLRKALNSVDCEI